MIRRVNFTGRIKIRQNSVSLNVTNPGTSDVAFSCSVDLSEYKFPDDAEVFIDVYKGSYIRKRFSLGKIKSPEHIINQKIPELSDFPVFTSKLNVVDTRKGFKVILGLSSSLSSLDGGSDISRVSLLPVKYIKGMSQVWKLDYETGRAVLLLNSEIPEISDLIKNDSFFRHTVLPAVFREIMFRLFIFERVFEDEDDNDSYRGKWLHFLRNSLEKTEDLDFLTNDFEDSDEPDFTQQLDAIERIVEKFSENIFSLSNAGSFGGR